MSNRGGASGSSSKEVNLSSEEKYLIFVLFVLILLFIFSTGYGSFVFLKKESVNVIDNLCGDDTLYNSCSSTEPYFCQNGKLVELATLCGCPEGFVKRGDGCFSSYQTNPTNIRLNYTLRGEVYYIDFIVYKGFEDYISKVVRSISYPSSINSSRKDFILKTVEEKEQRKFLMPLVIQIQNITDNKDDQMRIAISLVQNIPFEASNKTYFFGSTKINYSRYPYEVLYDMKGICGEKSDLLAFLLKEMGYGISSFYYAKENHEALGIRCPKEESLVESGYCFLETTGPAIITDNQISYVDVGKLVSTPEIYLISEGKSIGEELEEYEDADKLIWIRNSIEVIGVLGPIQKKILEKIKIKYGLPEEYYG
jgi:hypothetical protein